MLKKVADFILKRPLKTALSAIFIIIILATGATQVRMATGNDTLVQPDSDVFQNNKNLEDEFGGESIIVLYEGKNIEDLLTTTNLKQIKGLETKLQANDSIYSIISPVTLVEEISQKQQTKFKEGLNDVAEGMDKMGAKLIEIGENMKQSTSQSSQSSLPNLDGKLNELNQGLSQMIKGQEKLKEGTANLVAGYQTFGNQTKQISTNLRELASNLEKSAGPNPEQQMQIQKLKQMNNQLAMLSTAMIQVSEQGKSLPTVPDNTIKGLKGMGQGLGQQTESLNQFQKKQKDKEGDLKNLSVGLIEMGEQLQEIGDNLENMLTNSDSFLPGLPTEKATLENMVYEDGQMRSIFDEVIIEQKFMLVQIKFNSKATDSDKNQAIATIENYLDNNPLESIETMVSGKPALDNAIRSSMRQSMQKMMLLSILIMLIVLTLSFNVQWRVLPLAIILVAVVGTVGLMGWLSIPITMVSMAVFPILIGLGIDYAIQFQSRYVEEMQEGTPKISTFKTITKMVPAVLTALVATALGFIALYSSPVPMIQDFGKMLTVGMVVSFLIGLFLLIPVLYVRDQFFAPGTKIKTKEVAELGKFEKALNFITKKMLKLKWLVVILVVVTAALGVWVDLDAQAETDVETFMPQENIALQDIHKLRDVLGTTDQVTIVYEGKNVLEQESLVWVDQITDTLPNQFPDVIVETKSITTILKKTNEDTLPSAKEVVESVNNLPKNQLKLIVNEERSKGVITVGIKHLNANELKIFLQNLEGYLDQHQIENISTTITGKSVLDVEMVSALTSGRYKMTLLGMLYVFIGLLVIYRHPIKAFIPLLPILFIVGWSGGIMYLLGIKYTPLTATLGALIIGIGTEFTILIMERFFEEREKGKSIIEAILIANQKIGKAILVSALTTIGGFSALLASDFVILSNFGMLTLINIFLALFSTLIVMPVILVFLGSFVKIKATKVNGDDALEG